MEISNAFGVFINSLLKHSADSRALIAVELSANVFNRFLGEVHEHIGWVDDEQDIIMFSFHGIKVVKEIK